MTFKVVILSASASNLLACVRTILLNEPDLPPDHIIVVDDGTRAAVAPQLPGIRWVPGVTPFIFARNANLGIREAGTDVILLNDDARLMTLHGFTLLSQAARSRPKPGIWSAGIRGTVGNPNQLVSGQPHPRLERSMLAFVCVYLPKQLYDRVGPLDERFSGYGFEDNDYCRRVLAAGYELGIWDGCVVDHSGALPSTFRTRRDIDALFRHNQQLFHSKWKEERIPGDRRVDLLYLACNRLEFTQESFTTLLANTDWQYIRQLFVYDDGSQDGTGEWLEQNIGAAPVATSFLKTNFGSPVSAMAHFIQTARAPILVKIDNDVMLPPAWLRQSLEVLDRHPELSLLGIEAMNPHLDDRQIARSYTPAQFISGIGLYRRAAFARSQPQPFGKWFGLEEWQMAQGPGLVRGWITPALPVFLLDRVPLAPWKTYSAHYIERGWQRSWPKYDPTCTLWHWRWPAVTLATPAISSTDLRFAGALRIKNEAQHIHDVLTRVLALCQHVFVFDDHSTDATLSICRSFGDQVTILPSPFDGLDEARDKNYLLKQIVDACPEWVLWIDGDEVLERSGPERLRLAANNRSGVTVFALRIAYVWGDTRHVRVDGIFGRFVRPSFFRVRGQPVDQLHFMATGVGGNFHCGNVPRGLTGGSRVLNVRLKHFGYMTREKRQAKYEWYNAVDPNNTVEDQYRHLAEIPGARYAPGPPLIVPWIE